MSWQPIETAPRDGTRVLLWGWTMASGEASSCIVARMELTTHGVRTLSTSSGMLLTGCRFQMGRR